MNIHGLKLLSIQCLFWSSIVLAVPRIPVLLGLESLEHTPQLLTQHRPPGDTLLIASVDTKSDPGASIDPDAVSESPHRQSVPSNLEVSGIIGLESIFFTQDAADPRQDHTVAVSLVAEPEFVYEWDNGKQLIAFKPFIRLDQQDSERTHFDVRELIYERASRDWELRLGIGKVFWGVTEFQHLIDIINQTDLVENLDTEDKLGQPMVNFAWIQDWGTVDFFLLPYFRERTFPGIEGRLRSQPVVDTNNPLYESSSEQTHLDAAVRYSHYFGDWDVGIAHFYGTSREPRLLLSIDPAGTPVLRPFYDIINQTSLDLQATKGNMLWKLEAFYRRGQGSPFTAFAGGFEYTFVGAFNSNVDIGVLGEYHYDSRGESAASIFEDDIAIGTRLAFNDAQSSELLAGLIWDRNTSGKFFNVEASRRIGNSFFLELESRFFVVQDRNDPAFAITRDDHFKLFMTYNY